MLFVEPDVGHSAKHGDTDISGRHRWPWLGKASNDRRFICDIGLYKFDKLPETVGEISPGRGSNIQDANILRIFSSDQKVVHDPTPQKT